MLDPVINSAGITYERSSIQEWLKTSCIDPVTRTPLVSRALFPNVALRSQIDDYVKANGVPADWQAYADTLTDTGALLKLARLGVVSCASVSCVKAAYDRKKLVWQKSVLAQTRAERRAKACEHASKQLWNDVKCTGNILREMVAEAAKAGHVVDLQPAV